MKFTLDDIKRIKNEYTKVMSEIRELSAWEFTWDYGDDPDVPTEGPEVIYIPETDEADETLIELIMNNGVVVFDNKESYDYIIHIMSDTYEKAWAKAFAIYRKRFNV